MNEADTPAQPSALALLGIQLAEALARFAGNEQRLRHWLLDFGSYGPATAQQIRSAVDAGAIDQAMRLTHSLKGRSGMLGMTDLHAIALTLEQTLKNCEPSEPWLAELERTIEQRCAQIGAALGEASA